MVLNTLVDEPRHLWTTRTAHNTGWNQLHILKKMYANVVFTKEEFKKQLIWNTTGAECRTPECRGRNIWFSSNWLLVRSYDWSDSISVISGMKRRRQLQSRRPSVAERKPLQVNMLHESSAVRALCRADGPGRGVESRRPRGACRQGQNTPPPNQNPSPQPVAEAPKHSNVTTTSKTARTRKPDPKTKPLPNRLLGSPRRKQPRVIKTRSPNPQHPTWWSPPNVTPPHPRNFLVSSITFPSKHV